MSNRESSDDLIRRARDRIRERGAEEVQSEPVPMVERSVDPPVAETVEPPEVMPSPQEPEPGHGWSPPVPQPKPRRSRLWLTAVSIGVGVAFAVFSTIGSADRDDSGQIVDAGDIDALAVRVGDCFDDPTETDVVFELAAVPCSEPHDNEVFAVESVEGVFTSEFPGRQALDDYAVELCSGELFDQFVGIPYLDSALDIFTLTPTEESWGAGDREIVCAVYRLDLNKMTGTVRGSGI